MPVRRATTSALFLVGLATVVVAQAPVLDVKLGLWENTIVTNIGGMTMPQMDTSKLPPEQAARMAEAMKAMGGGRTVVEKHCLTKEDLSRDSFMLPQDGKLTCKRTVTTNTAARFAADIECTGSSEMKGQIDVESSAGGTVIKNTMHMAVTGRGRSMNMTMIMTGKYLGPECGTVK